MFTKNEMSNFIPPMFSLSCKNYGAAIDQCIRIQNACWQTTLESLSFAMQLQEQLMARALYNK